MPVHDAYRALIRQERRRQDARWGGPAHDDAHLPEEWRAIIAVHLEEALVAFDRADSYGPPGRAEVHTAKQRIVELAALGCAVSEVLERAWRGRSSIAQAEAIDPLQRRKEQTHG